MAWVSFSLQQVNEFQKCFWIYIFKIEIRIIIGILQPMVFTVSVAPEPGTLLSENCCSYNKYLKSNA